MPNKLFNRNGNFALLAINDAYIDLPENSEPIHIFSDGTQLLSKIPMEIDIEWKDWLGSLKTETIMNSNLVLFDFRKTSSSEHSQTRCFKDSLSQIFQLMQLLGVTEYREANIILGAFKDENFYLREVSKLPMFYPTKNYTPEPINLNSLKLAIELKKGFNQIEYDKEKFIKVKKGLSALMDGLKKEYGEDRIHEFVRSLEALILPKIGQTKKQFVHRCQTFIKVNTKSREILEEAFDLRSMTEHLNNWEKALESYPEARREQIALLRTRQIERLACLSYAHLLRDESIKRYFISEKEMKEFWSKKDDQRKLCWGNLIDLDKKECRTKKCI